MSGHGAPAQERWTAKRKNSTALPEGLTLSAARVRALTPKGVVDQEGALGGDGCRGQGAQGSWVDGKPL